MQLTAQPETPAAHATCIYKEERKCEYHCTLQTVRPGETDLTLHRRIAHTWGAQYVACALETIESGRGAKWG